MTVLNFITEEKAVYLVMDSLFSDATDMSAAGFTTKALLLPHLEGLVAGTGAMQFIFAWMHVINTSAQVRDVIELDGIAPSRLRALWAEFEEHYEHPGTATLYHFGFNRRSERFVTYAYRSERAFVSEELPCGLGVKPATDVGQYTFRHFPGDFLPIVEQQMREDQARPTSKRVGIGGHLIAYTLTAREDDQGSTHVILDCRRFTELPGYEQHCLAVRDRLERQ